MTANHNPEYRVVSAYFDSITDEVVLTVDKTKSTFRAAVAWATEQSILDAITRAQDRKVDVEIVLDDNETNRAIWGEKMANFPIEKLFFRKNTHGKRAMMHNKFAVSDNSLLLTGSANWTKNANQNDENLVFIKGSAVSIQFLFKFHELKLDTSGVVVPDSIFEIYPNLEHLFEKDIIDCLKRNITQTGLPGNGEIGNIENEQVDCLLVDSIIVDRIRNNYTPEAVKMRGIRWHAGERNLGGVYTRHNEYLRESFTEKYFEEIQEAVPGLRTYFMLRAISRVMDRYQRKLSGTLSEEHETRILRVFQYLLKERNSLALPLGIVIFPSGWGTRTLPQ